MKSGVFDYLAKPFKVDDMLVCLKRAFEPGDRQNAASDVVKLDMRTLDERHAIEAKKAAEAAEQGGTVTITAVVR